MANISDNVEMAEAEAAPTPAAQTPDGPPAEPGEKTFVPFFNEDYQFRLGGMGELGLAYRLIAIFVFMVAAAVMMYLCAWWWVGTHPLAKH